MQQPRRSRGRPRRADIDEQIVATAQQLLREHGPEAVNVASVAAESGIARTTIYRRYRDRQQLLTAVLRPITQRGTPPEGDDVEAKLAWVLQRTAEVLDEGIGYGGVAAVLAHSDPEFDSALRDALAAGIEPIRDQIAADVAHGALPPDADPDLVVNLLLGAHLAESLRHGAPSARWRQQTAARLSRLLVRTQPPGASSGGSAGGSAGPQR